MSSKTQSKLRNRLAELLKSDAIDTDPAVQAEFDRIESQLIASIGEWEFSKVLDRILADMVSA